MQGEILRKRAGLVLAVALAASLTACGGGGGSATSQSSGGAGSSQQSGPSGAAPTTFPAEVSGAKKNDGLQFPEAMYSDGLSTTAVVYTKEKTVEELLQGSEDQARTGNWTCGTAPLDTTGLSDAEAEVEKKLGPTRLCAQKAYEGAVVVMQKSEAADIAAFGDALLKAWK